MIVLQQIRHLHRSIKYFNVERLFNNTILRSYSVYPPYYRNPIVSKSEIENLKASGEAEALAQEYFRPALGDQTTSEFYDPIADKFISYIMREGKKQLARNMFECALEKIKRTQLKAYHEASIETRSQILLSPLEILHKAVENSMPVMELKPIKKGGSTYQVPTPISEKRQKFLAMNWLIQAAKDKLQTTPFIHVLATELIDAAHNRGRVVKKKQNLHKQCEANRAYAHFRWS